MPCLACSAKMRQHWGRTQQGTATSRHCLVGGSGGGVCVQLQGHQGNGSNAAKAATGKQIPKGNATGTQQGCNRKPAAMTGERSRNPARTQEVGRVVTGMQRKQQKPQQEFCRAVAGTQRERLGPQQIRRGSAAGTQQKRQGAQQERSRKSAGLQQERTQQKRPGPQETQGQHSRNPAGMPDLFQELYNSNP